MLNIHENISDEFWKTFLLKESCKTYFSQLNNFLSKERESFIIYPNTHDIFASLNFTPFEDINVVILGQDPYHGTDQANGLCFSVKEGIKIPPSLKNIFKEIKNDIGCEIPTSGNLERWAKQGVLLLNATLTVRAHKAGSHQNKGWETLTNAIISEISNQKKGIIFILWGNYAQKKIPYIDPTKHFILSAAHPSPLSAYNGFFGCKHFSKTNEILISQGKNPINWDLTKKT